ncbi:MAG TPA: HlyD family efflux transporter periplasmic adaptor subunit [Burkholderiaceae bacterium]|nr:HlyD family efflux transporter periplasmic adaptor subunit [Burkholderiaceae bacterium]
MTSEAALLNAEVRSRSAETPQALAFTIVNETWQLVPYRQALVWRKGVTGPDLLAVSGLASIAEDSPFTVWAKRLLRTIWPLAGGAVRVLNFQEIEDQGRAPEDWPGVTPDLISGWEEWWPPHLMVVPMVRGGECYAIAMFLLDAEPRVGALATMARLQGVWTYCFWALTRSSGSRFAFRLPRGRLRWLLAAVLCGVLAYPTHQTALAPAEIIALDGVAVAAPLDGVIKRFAVEPNQNVRAGQLLFALDDTTLSNRREVTARALEVAAAELLSAQQRAFSDDKARGEVAVLQSRIAERRAELKAVEEQLKRVEIRAPGSGIAVFGDTNDWQGKPVVTGERVMQLADPSDAGVLIYLPVADAIALEPGARIRIFLQVDPLKPLEATLSQTSYQAVLSPDGVSSYRLRGTIRLDEEQRARIGLKGTAKVYGDSVPLIYYMLRRPLATLRQWSGL